WVNGDLNANKATLFEGDSVAYQDMFSGLSTGSQNVYTFGITFQSTNSSIHAQDYITTYDYTWHGGSNSGTSVDGHELDGTGLPTTTPFPPFTTPLDPTLNGSFFPATNTMVNGHTQLAGQVFKLYGGTILGVNVTGPPPGYQTYALTGNTMQTLNIQF